MSRGPAFLTGEDPAYYAVLGVATDAPPEAIAAAYRALMRRHHPDAAGAGAAGEDMAKQINEAFSVLGHAELRDQYDAVHGYPRPAERVGEASGPPSRPKARAAPPRQPGLPAAPEQGAPAMLILAVLIAAAAALIVGLLVALAREQRSEMAHPPAPPASAAEPR